MTEFPEISSPRPPTKKTSKQRVQERLGQFDPYHSEQWTELTERFGSTIKQDELVSIANILSNELGITVDRDARRQKTVLIKWFSENWNAIHPLLDYVEMEEVAADETPMH